MKLKTTIILAASAMVTSAPGALLLHWNLDDASGTTAADSSGNGYDGNYLTGTPAWTATGGPAGGYATFAGTDNNEAFRTTTFPTISGAGFTPFTISLWIRPTDTSNNTAAVLRTGVNNSYYSVKTQNGAVRQIARNTGEVQNNVAGVNDGNWHHVVAVYNSETSRDIYLDGALSTSNTTSVPFLVPTGFSIGALDRSNSSVVDEFAGDIDDVQLYDNAVSAADVTFLFNNAGTAIAVPEPSSSLMLGLTLGLGLLRRRR
ncbi:LamG domain-containing protein [Akkermansiaceae bacterium]|nr:LamG domain-containing protein [Akkermansiaceae bacterium]